MESLKAPICIGPSKNFNKKPIKFDINGKKLIGYRTKNGSVSVLNRTCPHRGADMSCGKLFDDKIQCPYHGWEFDSYGNLVNVPSVEHNGFPTMANIYGYDTLEKGGFVWINAQDGKTPVDYCDELLDKNWTKIYGNRNLEGAYIDWIMNGVDISHINYVHDFANEDDGRVTDVKLVKNEDTVDCYATVRPKASSALTEHMQPEIGSSIHSKFVAPHTSVIKIQLKEPYEFITFTSLYPIDKHRTHMSWCLLYPKLPLMSLPLVYERFYNEMHRTISQDEAIIKNIEPLDLPYKVNVPCDKFQVLALELLKNMLHEIQN